MSEIKFEARRSSFQVQQPPSIINQRRTSFTNNMAIPDLLVSVFNYFFNIYFSYLYILFLLLLLFII